MAALQALSDVSSMADRINAALMTALQALSDVQDDPDADQELRDQIDLVKEELMQRLLENRRRRLEEIQELQEKLEKSEDH